LWKTITKKNNQIFLLPDLIRYTLLKIENHNFAPLFSLYENSDKLYYSVMRNVTSVILYLY
jgi:hypothetical protein